MKPLMEKKYAISRCINGISLNSREYVLDENNNVMLFETEKEAVRFVLTHWESVTTLELKSLRFEGYELRGTDPNISDIEWLECSYGIHIDTY